jgi:hypothetical protein
MAQKLSHIKCIFSIVKSAAVLGANKTFAKKCDFLHIFEDFGQLDDPQPLKSWIQLRIYTQISFQS